MTMSLTKPELWSCVWYACAVHSGTVKSRRPWRKSVGGWPAGITDIAPTLLVERGLHLPVQMTGRVLGEAVEGEMPPPAPQTRILRSEAAGVAQCLQASSVGATVYLDRGWVEGKEPA